jgi:hypothetical protein
MSHGQNGDTRRLRFIIEAMSFKGDLVLWGQLDCSELVARAELAVGLPDRRATWRAQDYAANYSEPDTEDPPKPGSLGFYGSSWLNVEHVVIALDHGRLLSADGASRHIKTPEGAKARGAKVRIHDSIEYRRDIPFLGWRLHPHLDTPGPDAHPKEPT